MRLSTLRRRTGVILYAVIAAVVLLLSSCRGGGSQRPDQPDAVSFLKPYQVKTSPGEGDLYDLTPLLGGDSGVLCAYGLSDEDHLLLLRSFAGSGGDKRMNIQRYDLQLFDLRDGSASTCASFSPAEAPAGESGPEITDLEILSADPAVVFDRRSGVLYRPLSDVSTVILPEWLRDSTLTCLDGKIWVSSDRGILYLVREDGALEAVWTLPCEYGAFTPVISGQEGRLTFSTYLRKAPYDRILVDVDPITGESEFYLSDLGISRFSVYCGGLLMGTSFRTEPVVSVCSPSSKSKKELELPEEIESLLRGSSSDAPRGNASGGSHNSASGSSAERPSGSVTFSTVPLSLCGGWCTFMLRDDCGNPSRIYLWDTRGCAAVRWDGPSRTPFAEPEAADYGELSRRAAALEDRYGIRIVLGDNIPAEFTDYRAEPVTDPSILEGSLSVLENVFSLYPDGYFADLKGAYYRDIVLYLTGALTPLNMDTNISNAGGFATESGGLLQIAFDLYGDIDPSMVIHELTHAADYRFLGEGLFSEEEWNAMNPDGFSYYLSYIDESGESYETAGSYEHTAAGGSPAAEVYFIDPYSKTYPMEDRARLMETLLSGRSPYSYCLSGEHVQEKLSYYFRFLRETLGNDSWPSSTAWEEALREASSKSLDGL